MEEWQSRDQTWSKENIENDLGCPPLICWPFLDDWQCPKRLWSIVPRWRCCTSPTPPWHSPRTSDTGLTQTSSPRNRLIVLPDYVLFKFKIEFSTILENHQCNHKVWIMENVIFKSGFEIKTNSFLSFQLLMYVCFNELTGNDKCIDMPLR